MRPRRSAQVPYKSALDRLLLERIARRQFQKRLPFRAGRVDPGSRARSWKPARLRRSQAGRPPVRKGAVARRLRSLKHFPRLRHVSGVRVDSRPRLWSRSGCCRRRRVPILNAHHRRRTCWARLSKLTHLVVYRDGDFVLPEIFSNEYSEFAAHPHHRLLVLYSACHIVSRNPDGSAVSHGRDQVESVPRCWLTRWPVRKIRSASSKRPIPRGSLPATPAR